jgi:hypothetical protein
MRKIVIAAAAVAAAATFAAPAAAQAPFPSAKAGDVYITAETVTTDGVVTNQFAPGSTVVFRARAVEVKTKKIVGAQDARYFYVTIPGQPNVKLKFDPSARGASARMTWTGTWTVPAGFRTGLVEFKALVQTKSKLRGSFVQVPVTSAMLTISNTPQVMSPGTPAAAGVTPNLKTEDFAIYADTVNGSRPTGAKPRPVGCAQTSAFKRGEQLVVRAWGIDLSTGGTVLSNENVAKAEFSVPGLAPVVLAWGPHGPPDARVLFWANAWNIAADYPLGEVTVKITFTMVSGKTVSYDHVVAIIP